MMEDWVKKKLLKADNYSFPRNVTWGSRYIAGYMAGYNVLLQEALIYSNHSDF